MVLNKKEKVNKQRSPFLILLAGFAILILIGTILLFLPISHKQGQTLSFIDSFFLSTSAVCVTGLVSSPLPLNEVLSPFGVFTLWALIEVGGLGFITLVTFAFSFAKKHVGISTNMLLKEAMNQNSYQGLMPLAKKIVVASFSLQIIGLIFIFLSLTQEGYTVNDALYYSFFHTASSFNNAGFDIFGSASLIPLKDNPLFMTTTALLITFGGLGFVVIFEILKKKKYKRFNLHTKIVINTTLVILVMGTLITWLLDWRNMNFFDALLQVIFARTAGFYSVNLANLRNSTLIILMVIMFIGGSPTSIAGGVKTTTFYTIIHSITTFGRGKKHVIAHNREINQESILKSYVLVTAAFSLIAIVALIIFTIEENMNSKLFLTHQNLFKEVFFESVSAFATCGTSLGITASLSWPSKLVLIFLMYAGRLGPITFISLLNKGDANEEEEIGYVEENIIIG